MLADGDNELTLDLDNALLVDAAVALLRGRKAAVLVDLFPGPDELCVEAPEGRFAAELIVPYRRAPSEAAPAALAPPRATIDRAPVARTFPPGSGWLFAKIYGGPVALDQLLREALAPLVAELRADRLITGWFFLRYADPDVHLRVRFAGDPAVLAGQVLPRLSAALAPSAAEGVWSRLVLDTYQREIERYGGPAGIELAEKIFEIDSDCVLAAFGELEDGAGAAAAWRLALRGLDALLDDLGLDGHARRTWAEQARDAFAAEHHADAGFRRQLGARWRAERLELEALLATPVDDPQHAWAPSLAAFAARRARLAPLVARLRDLERRGALDGSVDALAASFAHMFVNRMLTTEHRRQEVVLYDFLARYYIGQAARRGG